MPNKTISSKRAKRTSDAAKRARGADQARRRSRGPFRADWALLALLALSLAIRLWGIHDRLPDASLGINVLDDTVIEETDRTTTGRAWIMWRGGTKPLDLNPHTGGWPALSFYLTLAIQYAFKIVRSLAEGGMSSADFQRYIAGAGSAAMFLFARVAGALIGVGTVFLTYRLGARYLGRPIGLLAGLLLATNTLHVLTSQHVSDPNLLALFFVLLATAPLIRVEAGGGMRDSILAGAAIGLAGACKYVPLALSALLALAHRMNERGRRIPFLRNKEMWAGLCASAVAMFLASPFLFLDWKHTVTDIAAQRRALFSDWVGQTVFPISLPTYLTTTLPHVMGWPAYLLGIAGLFLLWRGGRAARTFVWIPALTLLANGMLRSPQDRYVLVALPYLHLGAALAILRGTEWVRARLVGRPPATALAGAAIVTVASIAWPMPELIATRQALRLPDSRHVARRWIIQNLDPNRATAVELYGPVFTPNERALVIWPFFATQSQYTRCAFYPVFLDGLDYHVASGEISRRFESEPQKYPVENAYYAWLRTHGRVLWESDPKTMSGPHIVVRALPQGISTVAQRDSLWRAVMPKPTQVNRVELWCADYAKMFLRLNQPQRSEEWARRGLTVNVEPMEAEERAILGMALWREGRLDSAEAEVRTAVRVDRERNPRNVRAQGPYHLYLGGILTDRGRIPEALEEYRASYALSGDASILLNIAQALGQIGRFDEAIDTLLHFPLDHPDRSLAARDAAVLLLNHTNRAGEALELLRESIRLSPNQDQADVVRQQIATLEAALRQR